MVRRRRRGWPSRDVSCLASPSSTTPFLLRVRDSRAHLLSLRRATTPSPREGRPKWAHHAARKHNINITWWKYVEMWGITLRRASFRSWRETFQFLGASENWKRSRSLIFLSNRNFSMILIAAGVGRLINGSSPGSFPFLSGGSGSCKEKKKQNVLSLH